MCILKFFSATPPSFYSNSQHIRFHTITQSHKEKLTPKKGNRNVAQSIIRSIIHWWVFFSIWFLRMQAFRFKGRKECVCSCVYVSMCLWKRKWKVEDWLFFELFLVNNIIHFKIHYSLVAREKNKGQRAIKFMYRNYHSYFQWNN